MLRILLRRAPAAAYLLPALMLGQASPWYQTDFPPEEFQARWQSVYDKIGNNAVALLQGMPQVNGYLFPRQTNEFYYLCGIETPGSYLLLDAAAARPRCSCRRATARSRAPRAASCRRMTRIW